MKIIVTVLTNTDLDAIFDDLAGEFEQLRKRRDSQHWPTDTAVRAVLYKQLHLVREALSLASVMSMSREWKKVQFQDPIPLPDGGALRTLRDAGEYIANLPKAEHTAPAWRAASEALLLAAVNDGDTMLGRIGIIKALHASRPELPPTPRRKRTYRDVR